MEENVLRCREIETANAGHVVDLNGRWVAFGGGQLRRDAVVVHGGVWLGADAKLTAYWLAIWRTALGWGPRTHLRQSHFCNAWQGCRSEPATAAP